MARGKPKNGHKVPAIVLARPGDPYIRPDGTIIEEEGKAPALQGTSDGRLTPETFKASTRRSISELPAQPKVLAACGAVLFFTVLGVNDREICEALSISRAELIATRKHMAYTECFEHIVSEFINANSDLLISRLSAYSHGALDQVAHLAVKAKGEATRLSASKDILDRAGVRPQDNAQRQMVAKNELRIVISDAKENAISLELNGEHISD